MAKLLQFLVFPLVIITVAFLAWAFQASKSQIAFRLRKLERFNSDQIFMDDTDQNLLWFVHVSDIHINKFPEHQSRTEGFKEFAQSVPKVVGPPFFIVTGDLVDAKDRPRTRSEQYLEEWEEYREILRANGLDKPGYFNEVRGNHDAFNVLSLEGKSNYFASHSNIKTPAYSFVKETPFGKYSFVAVDACPEPGASRPFNFFGHMDTRDMDQLSDALHAFSAADHNHTIVFGHYPLVTVSQSLTSKGESWGDLSQMFSAYLCGHLHNLFGRAPHLYARHGNYLELEVADMGWSRIYRIFAIDHDLLSISDVKLNEWPAIVITNPKSAQMLLPGREPIHRIAASSHIRLLAFSPNEISEVEIEIDGKRHPEPVTRAIHVAEKEAPLYVSRWNPDQYSAGVHTITVTVTDKAGRKASKTQEFSVDGTIVSFVGFGSLLLSLNFSLLVKSAFLLGDFAVLGLLILPRLWAAYLNNSGAANYEQWKRATLEELWARRALASFRGACQSPYQFVKMVVLSGVLRFIELSEQLSVYLPLAFYGIYILFFPWFPGQFIQGEDAGFGLFYLRGIWINGHFVETLEGWWFGIFDVLLIYLPLTLFLSHRFCASLVVSGPAEWKRLSVYNCLRVVVMIGIAALFKSARDLWVWYGFYAGLFSIKLWWGLIALYLAFIKPAPQKTLARTPQE